VYEIERKYLLKPAVLKFLKKTPHQCQKLTQFYTKVTPDLSVRYRRVGKRYYKTVKKGRGGIREEYEKKISGKKYLKNIPKRIGYVIGKKRCLFHEDGLEYGVDIYKAPFEGLLVLEVEFSDKKAYEDFVLPPRIASVVEREVTEDEVYKNKNLALFGLPSEEEHATDRLMQKLRQLKKETFRYRKAILGGGSDEDLHQFRVSLRTAVSLLASCRFMCDENGCGYFKKSLKEIISVTNRKRDLDVMKRGLASFRKDVKSADMQKSFELLHETIDKEIAREERYIRAYLQSSRFGKIMNDYKAFIKGGHRQHETFYARYSVVPVCDYVIFSHFMKIKKRIGKIKAKDDDVPQLHKLRIDFKKMRYLLENFHELYDDREIKKLVKSVKKLQKVLGRFHDGYQQRLIFETLLRQQQDKGVVFFLENILLPQLHTAQHKEIVSVTKRVKKFLETEAIYRKIFIPASNEKT